MIDVNLTLFVQAFNFLIVCLILKHLLFKPALAALNKEKKATTNLEGGISEQQSSLQEKINFKEDTWKKYQSHFLKASPSGQKKPVLMFKEEIEPEDIKLTSAQVDQLTQQIQKSLVERIEHVRE